MPNMAPIFFFYSLGVLFDGQSGVDRNRNMRDPFAPFPFMSVVGLCDIKTFKKEGKLEV